MVRGNRLHICFVEFLNQGENKAGVATQLFHQICTAGGDELPGLGLAQNTAVFKGVADLPVQLFPICQHHNGGRAGKLAAYLLGQEHHGVALAAALGVPENAQLSVVQSAGLICLDCLVDAQILVVPGQDFCCVSAGVVKENEVLQQIKKVLLFADAPEHGLQRHAARFLLFEPLPLVEKLVLAAKCAHLGLQSVGEDQEGVVVEQVGDGVQIVGVVVGVGVLHVHPDGFQFHKQQRDAVDKAHNIRPAAVQIPVDFQFPDGEEVVVVWVLEVDNGGVFLLCPAAGLLHGNGDAVPNQEILFLVDLQQGCGGQAVLHEPLGLVQLGGGEPGIQAQQSLPKIPGQQNFLVAFAAQGAGFA